MGNYKYEMITLNFDMTRRCNLRCKFCARGPTQNQDITPQIIDAALDQLEGIYIETLRMSGGEPFLAPDMIDYLIDGVIKRQLAVRSITIFTNGTICDPQIASALKRFAIYLTSHPAIKPSEYIETNKIPTYEICEKSRISIIVSEDYHEVGASERQLAVDFYNNIHPLIGADTASHSIIKRESRTGRDTISLDGLTVDNIYELVGDTVEGVPMSRIDNRYSFVSWQFNKDNLPETKTIEKSITISTNGRVFVGCLEPFEKVDEESNCNIQNDDLFDWIEEYCWQHPATRDMNTIRQYYLAIKLCEEKGINVPEGFMQISEALVGLIDTFEKHCIDLHKRYRHCSPKEIQLGAFALIMGDAQIAGYDTKQCLSMLEQLCNGNPPDYKTRLALLSNYGRTTLVKELFAINSYRNNVYRDRTRQRVARHQEIPSGYNPKVWALVGDINDKRR